MSEKDNTDVNQIVFERQKLALETLLKEVSYRRDKAWKIFSWVSTILVSIVGGVVAISSNNSSWKIEWEHATILSISLLVLSFYSCLWIKKNRDVEKMYFNEIIPLQLKLGVRESDEFPKNPKIGYILTIILLIIAAIIAIWIVPFS